MESSYVPTVDCIAISLSFLVLFCVLAAYNYEVLYRTMVLLVAITGLFLPFTYYLPYFFILWRIFVGLNVSTERNLFIGRLKDAMMDDSSTSNATLSHWVVAVQQENRFLYTHAVGEVISGRGEKKPFKEIQESELKHKYLLTHIGYVTRKSYSLKMKEVVMFEPMKSGNSCQEFAVDIAFQLSSSRTFTFMRIMTLPRYRNMVFYMLISLSVVLQTFNIDLANVLNVAVITNVFVAIELSRIGIHNQPQKAILPVLRAYRDYPTRWNFFQLFLISVLIFILYHRVGLMETLFTGFVMLVIVMSFTQSQGNLLK